MQSKQKIAQNVLSHGNRFHYKGVILLYARSSIHDIKTKPNIIISVPKKSVKKATNRTLVKRKLRGILLSRIPHKILFHYDWMWIYKSNIKELNNIKSYFNKKIDELINKEQNNTSD